MTGRIKESFLKYWPVALTFVTLFSSLVAFKVGLEKDIQSLNGEIAELKRQNIRIWESMDKYKKEKELAEIQEWRRIVEPFIFEVK